MRAELIQIEQTEQYLMGKLSSTDRSKFEARMQQDPNMKLDVDFQRYLMDGISSLALKGAAVKGFQLYKLRRLFWKIGFVALIGGTVIFTLIWWSNANTTAPSQGIIPQTTVATTTSPTVQNFSKQNSIRLKMDLRNFPKNIFQAHGSSNNHNSIEAPVNSNFSVVTAPVQSTIIGTENSAIKEVDSGNQESCLKEWILDWRTSKEDLKKIGEEIQAAGGNFKVRDVKFRGDALARISFIVSNKNGEVSYNSPELSDNGRVCICFPEKGISAGWCGTGDEPELNFRKEDVSKSTNDIGGIITSNISETTNDKSWIIASTTTKEDLKRIESEISAAGGKFTILNSRYSGGNLVKISFVVSNKSGEVEYQSPNLDGDRKVCITFPEAGGIICTRLPQGGSISVGESGESESRQ